MTKSDYYTITELHDELAEQNKKLDKIVKQFEAQTRLQEGILKQLYILCQMTSRDSTNGRYKLARESEEAFMNTPFPGSKPSEN